MRFDTLIEGKNKISHALINTSDRTTQEGFLRDYSDYLYENKLRTFHGLDRLLLYRPDGSLDDVKYIFGCIDSSAVYDNYFEGVLAFDVSKLLYPRNELAAQYFCERLSDPKYSEHATIVVFVNEYGSESTQRFEKRLSSSIKCKKIDITKK
ncbi:MAG: hypothetical protein J6Z43_06615 [Clostridiales bacterium]|nr:hypothetical protein [Clostridiales bacterium]